MDVSEELREITIQGGGVSTARNGPFLADGTLTFAEWIMIVDEIAEIAPSASTLRLIDFDLRPRSIRLIEYAAVRKRRPIVEVESADEALRERLDDLAGIDLQAVSFPLDDHHSMLADSVTKKRTLHGSIYGALWARDLGIPVEIRTLVRPGSVDRIARIFQIVRRIGAARWKVDLIGPGHGTGLLGAADTERSFTRLIEAASQGGPLIDLHEGPSLHRSLRERTRSGEIVPAFDSEKRPIEIRTSRGQLFVSREGTITPGISLPISVGHARQEEIRNVLYRSDLLHAIHDPSRLRGKCGECDLGVLCGGSRARAWVVNGDALSSDPGCPWEADSLSQTDLRTA